MVAAALASMYALVQAVPDRTDPPDHRLSAEDCRAQPAPGVAEGCGPGLAAELRALRPGTTLEIESGSYDIGDLAVPDVHGTPEEPIRIVAADPAAPPLLRGSLALRAPRHLTLSGVRLEATVEGEPALAVHCGRGWTLRDLEVFGASETGAYSNLVISGARSGIDEPCADDEPSAFVVERSCFHHPYVDPALDEHPDPAVRRTRAFYHNVYVSFEGHERSNGVLRNNVFRGNRNGAGVKLGRAPGERVGAQNVVLEHNTFLEGRVAVILADDVRNNRIEGNIMSNLSGRVEVGESVGVYAARQPDSSNVIRDTHAFGVAQIWGAVDGAPLTDEGDNRIVSEDPRFVDEGECTGFRPTSADATRYGPRPGA